MGNEDSRRVVVGGEHAGVVWHWEYVGKELEYLRRRL